MRLLVIMLVVLGGCRSPSLPGGDGDGGAPADLARPGDGGGKPCTIFCTMGFTCCNNSCVNLRNDIHNCGACGVVCTGPQPFCDGTKCAPAPCNPACSGGMLCCEVQGPGPSFGPMCTAPTDGGTCPLGCPLCQ
jgi:hypothetical protein